MTDRCYTLKKMFWKNCVKGEIKDNKALCIWNGGQTSSSNDFVFMNNTGSLLKIEIAKQDNYTE